ncbi:MAG: terminase family protein [Oscillospiraceae bacterium]|nr:terminase family protein [Oscillospiraceae bacterium]
MEERVIWLPQPRQAAFMSRPEYECLYGGAAGGGKSDALLAEALRQVHIPAYRGLLLRKTVPQLAELIDRSRALYGGAFPGAEYRAVSHTWEFPSGAKISFGSMQHTQDRHNYQGRRFDFIGFDELTHFTWEEYSYMFSRNRPGPSPDGRRTRVYIRATANPGGVGHGWVKARFIDPAPPMTPVTEKLTLALPEGGTRELTRSRVFVPATVFDNQALLEADPAYLASLAMLPRAEREALLYGSWTSFSGQVFEEWRDLPEKYAEGTGTHVIEPFDPPQDWRCWRGFDFGYSRPYAVGWFLADREGRLYLAKELYGWDGTPNGGAREDPVTIARRIRQEEDADPLLRGRQIFGVADPSIFDGSRGESIADMMARPPYRVTFYPGRNARLAGKMQLHYRLAMDGGGLPMLQVFRTCRNFIRTVPALTYDPVRPEDVDTSMEDHMYDMCRYVLMESPISPPAPAERRVRWPDPLNRNEGMKR